MEKINFFEVNKRAYESLNSKIVDGVVEVGMNAFGPWHE